MKINIRGDQFESVTELKYLENVVLELKARNEPDAPWKKLPTEKLLFKKWHKSPLGNLFCMSALRINSSGTTEVYKINERLRHFDSQNSNPHYLLIYNADIFLNKIRQALDQLDFTYKCGLVDYLDLHTYTGEKTIFQKDISYSYQEEFRIFLDTCYSTEFTFSIGNIEHISSIYEFSKVPSFLIYGLQGDEKQ